MGEHLYLSVLFPGGLHTFKAHTCTSQTSCYSHPVPSVNNLTCLLPLARLRRKRHTLLPYTLPLPPPPTYPPISLCTLLL